MADPTLIQLRDQLKAIKAGNPELVAQQTALIGGIDEALDMIDDAIGGEQPPPMSEVVQLAQEAFWRVVAERYPRIKTGDVDPLASVQFDEACRSAVRGWLLGNRPQLSHDQLAQLGSMLAEASIGANGITTSVTAELAFDSSIGRYSQNQKPIHDTDMVVITAAQDDTFSEEPGAERTFVTVIGANGHVKDNWEVQ